MSYLPGSLHTRFYDGAAKVVLVRFNVSATKRPTVRFTGPGPERPQGACSFSVYIETRRGEGWHMRRENALIQALQVARAFLVDL
jgi:hypothetical protein